MQTDLMGTIVKVALQYLPFLFALCFHEYAHGWVARRKGDRTAEMMGRLTMNPFVHMDPIGTFILPIGVLAGILPPFFFGWAKPVPVNDRNLQNPVKDMFWIALAGPLSNLFLGTVAIFAYVFVKKYTSQSIAGLVPMLVVFIQVNFALAFFNLLPIHPLDGGKVLARFLPRQANYWLEENQGTLNIVLILMMITGAFRIIAYPIEWTAGLLLAIADKVI